MISLSLVFLFTYVASVLSVENGTFTSSENGTFFASSDYLTPRSSVGGFSESHMLRGLFTRQTCVDIGYAQCPGSTGCCPQGGSCCGMLSLTLYERQYTYSVDYLPSPTK